VRQTRKQRADRRKGPLPFAAVDGEGGDIDGKHQYLMLRAGERVLENKDASPLGAYQCLAFLADLPKDRVWCSFAFDYDVTMIVRGLTERKIALLFDREARAILDDKGQPTNRFWPVTCGAGVFEIDYMPHKEFRVRRAGEYRKHDGGKWTVINDVFTFFQSSFVTALRKWFKDQPEYAHIIEKIAEGKDQRNEFGAVTQYERDYNYIECQMLELLMEKFRDMCTELDVYPRTWQGPGNLVSAVFKREGLPRKNALNVPDAVWNDANTAYCAGRFEVKDYGFIEEEVHQYDINSAYASHYRFLPCLQHGKWIPFEGRLPVHDDAIYFAESSFNHREVLPWNTLPVRSGKGTLLFPKQGRGWYWCHELRVAEQYADLEIHRGWLYERTCECRNFDWVYALYDERDRVGKDSGMGKVLKIILATIYGKLAQSKGNPVFANPIWAGLIVSSCRAKLVDATLRMDGGRGVLMLATDGLFTTVPIPNLPTSTQLGDWTYTKHDNIFIVQSGVYFMPDEHPKTRGVPQAKVIQYESVFREVWQEWLEIIRRSPLIDTGTNEDIATFLAQGMPAVRVPLRVFVGARLAHARGKLWLAGEWFEEYKKVAFDWRTKRCNPRLVGDRLTTDPVEGHADLVSAAPKWRVGGMMDLPTNSMLTEDAPDWADTFMEVE
jgi:hypothetical protein